MGRPRPLGVDKHTAPLSQSLSPAATALRMHARFYFNALTSAGRAEARFGVEDSSSGAFYEIGVNANQDDIPVRLSVMSASKTVPEESAGIQTTNEPWDVFATFRRTGPASTAVDYVVQPPGEAAPYTGTTTLSTAVPTGATFDRIYLAFRQRSQSSSIPSRSWRPTRPSAVARLAPTSRPRPATSMESGALTPARNFWRTFVADVTA